MGIQRLFLPQTVLEAARDRMRWVFGHRWSLLHWPSIKRTPRRGNK